MTVPSLRHRTEYLVFRALRALVLAFPESVALGVGSAAGWLVGSFLRFRRKVVDENLQRAFPERDRAWRRRVAARSYRHFGCEAIATFRLAGETAESLSARVEIHGLDIVQRLQAEGRGAIFVTGHIGNWEIGGAGTAARGYPVEPVAFPQHNPLFDRDLMEVRERLGMKVIVRDDAYKAVLESLARGHLPAIVGDQNASSHGLFVDFFGRPAATHRGPALFSLRSDAPIVFGVALARPGRPRRYVIHFEEIPFERTGDVSRDVLCMTQRHVTALERWVRSHPDQYFWQHKRWKTRPPPSE